MDSVRSTAGPKKRANTTVGVLGGSRIPSSDAVPPAGFEPALPPPESGTPSNTVGALTGQNGRMGNAGVETWARIGRRDRTTVGEWDVNGLHRAARFTAAARSANSRRTRPARRWPSS